MINEDNAAIHRGECGAARETPSAPAARTSGENNALQEIKVRDGFTLRRTAGTSGAWKRYCLCGLEQSLCGKCNPAPAASTAAPHGQKRDANTPSDGNNDKDKGPDSHAEKQVEVIGEDGMTETQRAHLLKLGLPADQHLQRLMWSRGFSFELYPHQFIAGTP
jgi:hypothetical protein